jgi:tetratricopeptide (TPR) repeat protein
MRAASRRIPLLLPLALAARVARADTITLVNGNVIEADRAWFQGEQLVYEKNGGVFGLPKTLVKSVEQRSPQAGSEDPNVVRGRQRLEAGDAAGAVEALLVALRRDSRSLPALESLAEAYMRLGEPGRARDMAARAVAVDERSARARALLGDALTALGDRAGAETEYRKSLQLHPDSAVQDKLARLNPAALAPRPRAPELRIRYEGPMNEPLGIAVLQTLTQAFKEFEARLGFAPDAPVTVVLETQAAPQERRPEWADAVNDGNIRIPVQGVERLGPRQVAVLRHELAHSFISAKTGGNCPTWLQEGVSQWLEGGEPGREDGVVAAALREGRLLPLFALEAPFQSLSETEAVLAYAESLSIVAHLLRTRGEPAIVRLLLALSDRLPSEEALPVALALSYPELQRSWEQDLRALPPRPPNGPPGTGTRRR